jgi:hypothetical protein
VGRRIFTELVNNDEIGGRRWRRRHASPQEHVGLPRALSEMAVTEVAAMISYSGSDRKREDRRAAGEMGWVNDRVGPRLHILDRGQ